MTKWRWSSEFQIRYANGGTSAGSRTTYTDEAAARIVAQLLAQGWRIETQYDGHITLTDAGIVQSPRDIDSVQVFTFHRI